MNKIFAGLGLLLSVSIPTGLITWVLLESESSSHTKKLIQNPKSHTFDHGKVKPPIKGVTPKLNIINDPTPKHQQPTHVNELQTGGQIPVLPNASTAWSKNWLTNFNVSVITENPEIIHYLPDVDSTKREFRVYNNGLFKIKIETSIIGPGKFYANNTKADLQAKEIANRINFGPAVVHLEKGIQILNSQHPESLGGQVGVQVAVTNSHKSASDDGIINETSLITHEYGHHETMWDNQNQMDDIQDTKLAQRMIDGLRNAGYTKISDLVAKVDYDKITNDYFMKAIQSDFPTDYGTISPAGHSIFQDFNYPFDSMEVATRVLNILSFTTRKTLSAQEIYSNFGDYDSKYAFEPPAFLVSDATFRHFANDSVYGEGKDNSRVDKLIEFYMKQIFGLGKGTIQISGPSGYGNEINHINLDALGVIPNLDAIEVLDSRGVKVASQKVTSFRSSFGFKDELISDHQKTQFHDVVKTIDFDPQIKTPSTSGGADQYQIIGKDSSGKRINISGLEIKWMSNGSGGLYKNHYGLKAVGDHYEFDYSI